MKKVLRCNQSYVILVDGGDSTVSFNPLKSNILKKVAAFFSVNVVVRLLVAIDQHTNNSHKTNVKQRGAHEHKKSLL